MYISIHVTAELPEGSEQLTISPENAENWRVSFSRFWNPWNIGNASHPLTCFRHHFLDSGAADKKLLV